jgi:hypothetical protein
VNLPKTSGGSRKHGTLWIEWAFVILIVAAIVYTYFFFRAAGYLPLPFFPDPSDEYMDGYYTAWWTWNGRAYSGWLTIYPPLSFAIMKVISIKSCYQGSAEDARYCDWLLWSSLILGLLINGVLAYLAFRKLDRTTALPRALALTLGFPALLCLQRGNVLVFAWTGIILAFSPAVRSTRAKWIGIAAAINLKPYFVGLVLARLLRKEWRWVEGAICLTIIVYIISYIIFGSGTISEIYKNSRDFVYNRESISDFNLIVGATSYRSLIVFLEGQNLPLMTQLGSWIIEFWSNFFKFLIIFSQVTALLAIFLIWFRPEAVHRYRVVTIAFLLLLITWDPGGYAMTGAIFFVFLERPQGWNRIVAIICAYILSLPIDLPIVPLGSRTTNAYLAGHSVTYYNWLTLGPFIRPGLLVVIQLMLVIATVSDYLRYQRGTWSASAPLSASAS